MPKYKYECPECSQTEMRALLFSRFDDPQYCSRCNSLLTRVFHSRFQIIGEMEIHKRENQLYRIVTNGGGQKDQLAAFKEDQEYVEKENAELQRRMRKPEEFSADTILGSGLLEACKTHEGLAKWRADNIKDDPIPEPEPVEAIA
jgi:hypothetical protein